MGSVVLYPEAIHSLLTSPTGPVVLNMVERAERVLQVARALAAESEHTGVLAGSILKEVVPSGPVTFVRVGSPLPYARPHHDGTGPQHVQGDGGIGSVPAPRAHYTPPSNSPYMINWSRDHDFPLNASGNAWALAKHIRDFGTKAYPFLREALVAAR